MAFVRPDKGVSYFCHTLEVAFLLLIFSFLVVVQFSGKWHLAGRAIAVVDLSAHVG